MRRLFSIIFVLLFSLLSVAAEKRIYLVRGGELPSDVECVDLRPDNSAATWSVRNIYRSSTARYALFEKDADSWWQITTAVKSRQTVDLSMVDSAWTLCMRLRRTVNYPLTLTLGNMTTAEGYTISTAMVPADGDWVELAIPLGKITKKSLYGASFAGTLFRLHSDLGYAGDLVGIDYCYLTTDASRRDEGAVLPEKRYYFITNQATPLSGTSYEVVDYSSSVFARYSGWQQWSYISFPYFSQDNGGAVALQLAQSQSLSLSDADEDWCLIGQLQTDMTGNLTGRFYLGDKAYSFTIDEADLVRDGTTWNRVYLPLDAMVSGRIASSTDVLFSLSGSGLSAGRWSLASLMLTNEHSAEDPEPVVPSDPRNEQRVYLLNDGAPLPSDINCLDYRLDQTQYLRANYNNASRSSTDSYLTLQPTNGWWSVDIAAQQQLDLSAIDTSWTMYARILTTSAYRPINMILYKAANAEIKRYQLTEALLPVAKNGTWTDIILPLKTFFPAGTTSLVSYASGNRVFTLHSDGGGTSGVEVSLQYLYFSHAGESLPDPLPGEAPVDEPQIEGYDALEDNAAIDSPSKFIFGGHVYIRKGGRVYNVAGMLVK